MDFIVIFGPPAVGKMTVGHALSQRTGMPLFHNHLTIDLVLRFFPYGTPAFERLVGSFRTQIFDEVVESQLPGLIFTYVWALDQPEDKAFIDQAVQIMTRHGGRVCFVELAAAQAVRVERNTTPFRLANKAPKRNLEHSHANLLKADLRYRLNSTGDFFYPGQHLRIANDDLEPETVAEQVIAHFGLPVLPV